MAAACTALGKPQSGAGTTRVSLWCDLACPRKLLKLQALGRLVWTLHRLWRGTLGTGQEPVDKNTKNGECLDCHGSESSVLVLSVPWSLCWSVMPQPLPSPWACEGATLVVAAAQA